MGETRGSVAPAWKRRGSGAGHGREERRGSRRAATASVVVERESKGSSAVPMVDRGSAGEPLDETEAAAVWSLRLGFGFPFHTGTQVNRLLTAQF
jgi:hypothetical protein